MQEGIAQFKGQHIIGFKGRDVGLICKEIFSVQHPVIIITDTA
jgi:hypothetical protein